MNKTKISKSSLPFYMIILLLCMMVTGCTSNNSKGELYNQNDVIVKEGDQYFFIKRNGIIEENYMELTFSALSGYETIWYLDVTEDCTLTLDYESKITKGSFKVVLIDSNDNITKVFEQSQKGQLTEDVLIGKYRIKIVGKNASGKINMNLVENGYIKVESSSLYNI